MAANSFGQYFKVTTFGESHGPALGAIIDGCPAGLAVSLDSIQAEMNRRRPGSQPGVSARQEPDQFEVLSGIHEGRTLGTPIAMLVRNQDQRSQDYQSIALQSRIGHADDLWREKYGHSDIRGGGRSSGRETLSRVLAGAVAKQLLQQLSPTTKIIGYAQNLGPLLADGKLIESLATSANPYPADHFAYRLPVADPQAAEHLLRTAQQQGESWGGVVGIRVEAPPKYLGAPVFHKLKADLATALMGVGATVGFEFGAGFSACQQAGTQFHTAGDAAVYGGIRGGISTGETLQMQIGFKPTSSIMDVAKKGRHDPCIVPRAVPVCEAMVALVLADHLLAQRLDRL